MKSFLRTKAGLISTLLNAMLSGVIVVLSVMLLTSDGSCSSTVGSSVGSHANPVSVANLKNVRAEVAGTLTVLMNTANDYSGSLTADERVQAMDTGDTSVVNVDKLDSLIKYPEGFSDEVKVSVRQSLVKIGSLLPKGDDGLVVTNGSLDQVFIDPEVGLAYVPLSVVDPSAPPLSLEMVLTRDGWKLSPYTLLDFIRFASSFDAQGAQEAQN